MSQPSNSLDLSMDLSLDGQPWVSRIPGASYNLFTMDFALDGQPWVTWNPDSPTSQTLNLVSYFMWG